MSLKTKASGISFGDLDETESKAPAAPAVPSAPTARSGVAAITQSIGMHHKIQDLEAKVALFESGQNVVKIDPARVRESRWKNRHERAYATQQFAELKAEISGAGGNVVAVKVRPLGKGADGQDDYEIVYGRRRLRACQELGLQVTAVIEQMDDRRHFVEMERENRNREDLSPWEQGVSYKDALDRGLFPSQRQMSQELGVSIGRLSMAIALASLPEEVVNAFPSPLEIQYRWAQVLAEALEKDTARVMTVAAELEKESPRPNAKQVLTRLVSGSTKRPEASQRDLVVNGKVIGHFSRDHKGAVSVTIKGGVLNVSQEQKFLTFLDKLLS